MAKEQVKRKYSISDDEMIEDAKTRRNSFVEDQADFIAEDPMFNNPFETDWQTAINNSEAQETDEQVDDQLTGMSAAVEAEMEMCRRKFQNSKHFIEQAFPDSPVNRAIWRDFGYDNYKSAHNTQSKMIPFMKHFHYVAENKYKTELLGANYIQAKIDEIDTRYQALNAANQNQENFIKAIPIKTATRITTHNILWDIGVVVSNMGKQIYFNNWAKYQRYLLPPGEESESLIRIKGLITDTSLIPLPLKGVQAEIVDEGISVLSLTSGKYHIGGLPDGTYDVVFTKTGYVSQTHSVTITGGVAVVLNVAMQAI